MIFDNRADAGRRLAAELKDVDASNTVVIALPRGGVPVAAEICSAHGLPMDLVLVRKIGAPGQPELAVGAVTDGDTPHVTVNQSVAHQFRLSKADVEDMGKALLPEIERRRDKYLGGRARPDLEGKTLIVVDDGVATGSTLLASLKALKTRDPSKIIVAVPVAPDEFAGQLKGLADTVISLSDLTYGAVGAAYRTFGQVDDATVTKLLEEFGSENANGQ
ncbi:MAG: phosphoribosyltransferase family protein [Paracoccaceae bacterium]|nr:phosphoribosyltransferase family protein [Paracoccaceae bacterium]